MKRKNTVGAPNVVVEKCKQINYDLTSIQQAYGTHQDRLLSADEIMNSSAANQCQNLENNQNFLNDNTTTNNNFACVNTKQFRSGTVQIKLLKNDSATNSNRSIKTSPVNLKGARQKLTPTKNKRKIVTTKNTMNAKKIKQSPVKIPKTFKEDVLLKQLEILDTLDEKDVNILIDRVIGIVDQVYGDSLEEELQKDPKFEFFFTTCPLPADLINTCDDNMNTNFEESLLSQKVTTANEDKPNAMSQINPQMSLDFMDLNKICSDETKDIETVEFFAKQLEDMLLSCNEVTKSSFETTNKHVMNELIEKSQKQDMLIKPTRTSKKKKPEQTIVAEKLVRNKLSDHPQTATSSKIKAGSTSEDKNAVSSSLRNNGHIPLKSVNMKNCLAPAAKITVNDRRCKTLSLPSLDVFPQTTATVEDKTINNTVVGDNRHQSLYHVPLNSMNMNGKLGSKIVAEKTVNGWSGELVRITPLNNVPKTNASTDNTVTIIGMDGRQVQYNMPPQIVDMKNNLDIVPAGDTADDDRRCKKLYMPSFNVIPETTAIGGNTAIISLAGNNRHQVLYHVPLNSMNCEFGNKIVAEKTVPLRITPLNNIPKINACEDKTVNGCQMQYNRPQLTFVDMKNENNMIALGEKTIHDQCKTLSVPSLDVLSEPTVTAKQHQVQYQMPIKLVVMNELGNKIVTEKTVPLRIMSPNNLPKITDVCQVQYNNVFKFMDMKNDLESELIVTARNTMDDRRCKTLSVPLLDVVTTENKLVDINNDLKTKTNAHVEKPLDDQVCMRAKLIEIPELAPTNNAVPNLPSGNNDNEFPKTIDLNNHVIIETNVCVDEDNVKKMTTGDLKYDANKLNKTNIAPREIKEQYTKFVWDVIENKIQLPDLHKTLQRETSTSTDDFSATDAATSRSKDDVQQLNTISMNKMYLQPELVLQTLKQKATNIITYANNNRSSRMEETMVAEPSRSVLKNIQKTPIATVDNKVFTENTWNQNFVKPTTADFLVSCAVKDKVLEKSKQGAAGASDKVAETSLENYLCLSHAPSETGTGLVQHKQFQILPRDNEGFKHVIADVNKSGKIEEKKNGDDENSNEKSFVQSVEEIEERESKKIAPNLPTTCNKSEPVCSYSTAVIKNKTVTKRLTKGRKSTKNVEVNCGIILRSRSYIRASYSLRPRFPNVNKQLRKPLSKV